MNNKLLYKNIDARISKNIEKNMIYKININILYMDLQNIRQQKHQQFLKQKAIDEEKQKEQKKIIENELTQLNDIEANLKQNVADIKKFDVMKILLIVSTFLRKIDLEISLITKYNKTDEIITIFFSLVNKIIESREQTDEIITVREIKFLNNIKNNLYKIMDLINLDRSLLDIELMDTSNDVDIAKKLHNQLNHYNLKYFT